MSQKIKVAMVEPPGQLGYVPIANGYLVAYAMQDPAIRDALSFKLNTRHFHEPVEMVLRELLAGGVPDIAAFSCQGWSVRRADLLAAKLREINPAITIIYGGNHVSHQGEAFFQSRTFADVLVNGEGEATFCELLQTYLDGRERPDFSQVRGVSFRTADGSVLTTPPRDRIKDLSTIPSPYLSGVLDVTPENCRTALLETNRGCPYSCSVLLLGRCDRAEDLHVPARSAARGDALAGAPPDRFMVHLRRKLRHFAPRSGVAGIRRLAAS